MPAPLHPRGKLLSRTLASRLIALVLPAGLAVWLAFVVASGQPNIALHVYPATLRLHAVEGALLLAFLASLLLRRRLPGPTPLDWHLSALAAVYGAAALLGVYPRLSLESALTVAVALVAFYFVADRGLVSLDGAIAALVASVGAAALYALYRVAADYADWLRLVDQVEGVGFATLWPPTVPRVQGVGDHVNLLAMALNMALPFALVAALQPSTWGRRAAAAAVAVAIALALFFTVTRSAWIALVPALAVFAPLYALRGGVSGRGPARLPALGRALRLALAAFCVSLAVGLTVAVLGWESRPEWLFRASLSPRQDAISVGLRVVRDRPLLGSGPNTFGFLYNAYSGDYPIENIHPHNGYIQAAADAGMLGLAVLAGLGVLLTAVLARAYREGGVTQRARVAACAAALVTLAVHSLADTPNLSKTALMPLAVVLAICVRLGPPPPVLRRSPLRPSSLPRLLPLALPALLAAAWLSIDRPHAVYHDSLALLAEGRFDEAASRAAEAGAGDPDQAAYQVHAGVSHAIAYLVQRDRRGSALPSLLDRAEEALKKALRSEGRSAVAYADLALVLRLRDDKPGASDAARRAMLRAPRDGTIAAVAGTVFEWAGLPEDAKAAYARAVTHDAALIQSAFWRTTPFRAAVRDAVISASFLKECQKARVSVLFPAYGDDLVALEAGCRRQVSSSPSDARARSDLAVVLFALGRRDEALAEARRSVKRAPDNPYARTSLAIALGSGDLRAVRHQLMLGMYLGDPDAALLLAHTYLGPAGAVPLARGIDLPVAPQRLPEEVRERLGAALPASAPMVFSAGVQEYLLGVLYFRVHLLRESPTSVLVPGDWLALSSPRAGSLAAAIAAADRASGP